MPGDQTVRMTDEGLSWGGSDSGDYAVARRLLRRVAALSLHLKNWRVSNRSDRAGGVVAFPMLGICRPDWGDRCK